MPIRHNFRDFTPDNANEDRADWNAGGVFDPEEGIGDVDQAVEQIIDGLPEQAEPFGRTSSEIDPDEPPKAFYHMDKSQEEMKNLGRPDEVQGLADQFRERVWGQVDTIKENGNRVQSNSVKFVDHLMTVSPQYFRPDDPNAAGKFDRDKLKVWLRDSLRTIKGNFAEKNLAAIEVHLDESTPHIHFQTVPKTQDGRLSVNDRFTPTVLGGMQDTYAQNLPDEIQRGEEDSPAERTTMKEVYHDTAEEVEKLRADVEVKDEEIENLRALADPIRKHVKPMDLVVNHDYVGADPGDYDNPIDYLTENTDLTFAEAAKIGSEALDSNIEEVKEDFLETKMTAETLKDTLNEVAQEHGLDVEAGEFHFDYSNMDQTQTPSQDPGQETELDDDMGP